MPARLPRGTPWLGRAPAGPLPPPYRGSRAVALLMLLPALAGLPVSGRAETLDDAFRLALDSDQRLQAEQQRGAAAEAQLSAARAARLPSVEFDGSYYHLDNSPSTTLSVPPLPPLQTELATDESTLYGVTGTLPLFTSGRITHGISAAKAAAGAEHANFSSTTQDIKLSVATAYIDVLRAQRLLALADSSVETLSLHAHDAAALYGKGLVARNDTLAADVALANARQDRLRAQNALDLAHAAYNRATGRALDADVQLDDLQPSTRREELPDYTQRALTQRGELQALDQQSTALRAQAKSTRAEQLPSVALNGGRYYVHDPVLNEDAYWSVGVNLRWTLFDGGQILGRARSYDRQADAAADTRRDAETQVRLQVRQAWLSLDETQKRIAVTEQARDQAAENLRVARDRYTQGVGTNTEVLDAETLRVRSETNYDNAIYDNVLALQRLRRASGEI